MDIYGNNVYLRIVSKIATGEIHNSLKQYTRRMLPKYIIKLAAVQYYVSFNSSTTLYVVVFVIDVCAALLGASTLAVTNL